MLLTSNVKSRKKRQNFSAEFKEQVVKAALSSPGCYAECARKYGTTPQQIARWCREYEISDTRWVRELKYFPRPSNNTQQVSASALRIESNVQYQQAVHEFSETKQISFSVDFCLPSGIKMHISNITSDLLRTVLDLF